MMVWRRRSLTGLRITSAASLNHSRNHCNPFRFAPPWRATAARRPGSLGGARLQYSPCVASLSGRALIRRLPLRSGGGTLFAFVSARSVRGLTSPLRTTGMGGHASAAGAREGMAQPRRFAKMKGPLQQRGMTSLHDRSPVELLKDGRGIYGIGVSDAFDFEAIAWVCGIDKPHLCSSRPRNLILRPDLLRDREKSDYVSAVLQKITGGF